MNPDVILWVTLAVLTALFSVFLISSLRGGELPMPLGRRLKRTERPLGFAVYFVVNLLAAIALLIMTYLFLSGAAR